MLAGFVKILRILSGAALRRSRRTHSQIQPRIAEVAVRFVEAHAAPRGDGVGFVQIDLRFGDVAREAVILRSRQQAARQVRLVACLPQTVHGAVEVDEGKPSPSPARWRALPLPNRERGFAGRG